MSNEPGFRINDRKGFLITFENGWTVSVQFGPGNYCDNYRMDISEEGRTEAGMRGSWTAEVAAWDADDKWLDFQKDGYTDKVNGHQSPADVLALMVRVAAFPAKEPGA